MDLVAGGIGTELIDLTDVPVAFMRTYDEELLAPILRRLLREVERPRANIGGTGPPGRVD